MILFALQEMNSGIPRKPYVCRAPLHALNRARTRHITKYKQEFRHVTLPELKIEVKLMVKEHRGITHMSNFFLLPSMFSFTEFVHKYSRIMNHCYVSRINRCFWRFTCKYLVLYTSAIVKNIIHMSTSHIILHQIKGDEMEGVCSMHTYFSLEI